MATLRDRQLFLFHCDVSTCFSLYPRSSARQMQQTEIVAICFFQFHIFCAIFSLLSKISHVNRKICEKKSRQFQVCARAHLQFIRLKRSSRLQLILEVEFCKCRFRRFIWRRSVVVLVANSWRQWSMKIFHYSLAFFALRRFSDFMRNCLMFFSFVTLSLRLCVTVKLFFPVCIWKFMMNNATLMMMMIMISSIMQW